MFTIIVMPLPRVCVDKGVNIKLRQSYKEKAWNNYTKTSNSIYIVLSLLTIKKL